MQIIEGKVWKFGDDINTDLISPGRYMNAPIGEIRKHVLEVVDPRFSREVKKGDIIIGGRNFGCGSSREEAPSALKACGIAAIAAESFARIFFRNAIAVGLSIVSCPGISSAVSGGDTIRLDVDAGRVTLLKTGSVLSFEPLPGEMKEVLSKGGILPFLKEIAKNQDAVKALK
jgi:3-isopropylmalate/(R)-2-methylmalate dehydratase small subunit